MPNKIKEMRMSKNYSQRLLADTLHISVFYLNRIERGRQKLDLKLAARIAKELDCGINDLLDGRENVENCIS